MTNKTPTKIMLHIRTGYRIIPIACVRPRLGIKNIGLDNDKMFALEIEGVDVLYASYERAKEVRQQLREALRIAIEVGQLDDMAFHANRGSCFDPANRPLRAQDWSICFKIEHGYQNSPDSEPNTAISHVTSEDESRDYLDKLIGMYKLDILDIREGCLEL